MLADALQEVFDALLGVTPGLSNLLGRQYLDSRKDPPPRVVWIPTTIRFGPTGNVGGNPRQIGTRYQRVELHCWHIDLGNAEALLNNAVVALDDAFGASAVMTDGACMTDAAAEVSRQGYVISAAFDLAMPVVAATLPTATLAEIDATLLAWATPVTIQLLAP